MVLFGRSWSNRAGVERVMGFCPDDEYEEFCRTVPEFEKMRVRSGIILLKYWFSITDDKQFAPGEPIRALDSAEAQSWLSSAPASRAG